MPADIGLSLNFSFCWFFPGFPWVLHFQCPSMNSTHTDFPIGTRGVSENKRFRWMFHRYVALNWILITINSISMSVSESTVRIQSMILAYSLKPLSVCLLQLYLRHIIKFLQLFANIHKSRSRADPIRLNSISSCVRTNHPDRNAYFEYLSLWNIYRNWSCCPVDSESIRWVSFSFTNMFCLQFQRNEKIALAGMVGHVVWHDKIQDID